MITKASLEAYRTKLEEQLVYVEGILQNFDELAGVRSPDIEVVAGEVKDIRSHPRTTQRPRAVPDATKQRRIRGVLSSVREILPELPDPFDKNDIMAKLWEKNSDLAGSVSAANLRNTLRILVKAGKINVEIEPTSTRCGRYSRKRAAELNEALIVNQ